MIKQVITALIYIFIIAIIAGSLQFFLLKNYTISLSITSSYLFLASTSFIALCIIYTVHFFFNKEHVGYTFLSTGIIKMGLSIWFLFPLIENTTVKSKTLDILSFFLPYFIFLTLETILVAKIIAKK